MQEDMSSLGSKSTQSETEGSSASTAEEANRYQNEQAANRRNSLQWHSSRRKSDISNEGAGVCLQSAKEREASVKIRNSLTTAGRLRFDTLGLHGRDEEVDILKNCLKRITDSQDGGDGASEMVFIRGKSGTGKTALAATLMYPVRKANGLYVKGKFDVYLRDEPYAGIVELCREMCDEIMQLHDVTSSSEPSKEQLLFERIRNEIITKLGSEIHLLLNIIPELSEIVGDEALMVDDIKGQGNEEAKARFNYAFRVFIRVVTSFFAPLVMVLDDLQWADAASLDLIDVLITDVDNPSLMIVGIYRSNEVGEAHLLSRFESDLKGKTEQGNFNLTEIFIGNLEVPPVNRIVMHLLSIDEPETTLGLAEICHKRSHGNVFFLLDFVKMLKDEGLLDFNLGLFKWSWDEDTIVSHTAATHNVVEMVRRRIGKLPSFVGQRLLVAACLGTSFEPAMLQMVWGDIGERWYAVEEELIDSTDADDGYLWIDFAEKDGIIERCGNTSAYQWIHDKVQEAAMSLVPVSELPGMKAQIGEALLRELNDTDAESSIFVIVNLLNEGPSPEQVSKRIELAELNLRAAKKAVTFSAFESSGKYATLGIEILPPQHWATHYDVALDLYSTAAEWAGYLGKVELMQTYCDRVLEQNDRPLSDKLRVYNVLLSHFGCTGRLKEAIDLLAEILKQLGCKFPKSKLPTLFSTVSGLLKAKAKIQSLTPEKIMEMSLMKDPTQLEIMKLLDKFATLAYRSGNKSLLPLVILASFRTTLKYGLCEHSPPAFARLGVILMIALNDLETGTKSGKLAILLTEKLKCQYTESRTRFVVNALVLCWAKPLASMRLQLLKGYEVGLSSGDTENGMRCICQYIYDGFQTGAPLQRLEADCRIYTKQMAAFAKETIQAHTGLCWQAVLNLMGRGEHSTTLEGEVIMDLDGFLAQQNPANVAWANFHQIILYARFGEFEKGAKFAIEKDGFAKNLPSNICIVLDAFCRGICLYATARKTRKRKYKKHAKKFHAKIKSWSLQGNPNVKHYEKLLNAELAVLVGKLDAAERWYQDAVAVASRTGFVHDAALANERYGEFLLLERNDKDEAVYKFEAALKLYREWGAARKVAMLRDEHADLWPPSTEIGYEE